MARDPHQVVDAHRRRSEKPDDLRALARGGLLHGGAARRDGSSSGACDGPLEHRREHGEDIVRARHERGALLEQAVGPFVARIERRARHGEDLAALFERHPRGDQRAGALRRFDDDDAAPTSPRSMRLRRGKSRARGSHPSGISVTRCAVGQNLRQQVPRARADRLGRGRRRAPRPCRSRGCRDARRRRCRGRDPTRSRSRHRRVRARAARRISCLRPTRCASRRSATIGPLAAGDFAAHGEKDRRRIVDRLQPRRIVRLRRARRGRRRCAAAAASLALGVLAASRCGPVPVAPPRRARSGRADKRRVGAAEVVEQAAERARADILAADQPQPVEPLLVAEPDAEFGRSIAPTQVNLGLLQGPLVAVEVCLSRSDAAIVNVQNASRAWVCQRAADVPTAMSRPRGIDGTLGEADVPDRPDQAVALRRDGYVIQWLRSTDPVEQPRQRLWPA